MQTLQVDGSYGEGGGQILRTAIAFSIITARPIHVTRIRAGRNEPGLRPQHLAALTILRDVCRGELQGAYVGSEEISFSPGRIERASLAVDMKTAASITLVLQAVVPAVSLSGSSLSLDLTGGTDVPWSPPFDYFATVVRGAFGFMGIRFTTVSSKRGYYPKGGGKAITIIEPCPRAEAVELVDPPETRPVSILSRCGRLPKHVAERQCHSASVLLQNSGIQVGDVETTEEPSDSPGSSIVLADVGSHCILGADALGARGKPAEEVGAEAGKGFVALSKSGTCLDACVSDMLAPFLSLGGGESRIRIPAVTKHLTTSLHVANLFTGCDYSFVEKGESTVLSVRPRPPA
jgi:RNA 3'-phosphate cyclase